MILRNVSLSILALVLCLPSLAFQSGPSSTRSAPISQLQGTADSPANAQTVADAQKALNDQCRNELDAILKEGDPEKKQALYQIAMNCLRSKRAQIAEKALQEKKVEAANRKAEKELDLLLAKPLTDDQVRALTPDVVSSKPAAESGSPTVSSTGPAGNSDKSKSTTVAKKSAAPQQTTTVGSEVHQSKWATPNACAVGTDKSMAGAGNNAQPLLLVGRQLLYAKDASDDYGRRLGKRFIVYQVTVTNNSKDFQFQVDDIVVDLKPIYKRLGVPAADPDLDNDRKYGQYQASSEDLVMLRGIPEKGADYDPRNMTLHIFQGIGSVAAGISGLTPFSDVMGSAVANFNGAFISGFTGIAPDHTANQLNRLSDTAFTTNTLIGKLQSKTFAIFIPEAFLLPKRESKQFWDNPRPLLNWLPLDQLNICVSGILLIQAQAAADPAFSTDEVNVPENTPITLSDTTSGATIYYTTNGDTPTTSSSQYTSTSSITVGAVGSGDLTVKAFATASNMAPSNVVVHTYTPAPQATAPKSIAIDSSSNTVTIKPGTDGDSIFYTTDGSLPGRSSSKYSVPFSLPKGATAVTAVEVSNTTAISKPLTQTVPPAAPAP